VPQRRVSMSYSCNDKGLTTKRQRGMGLPSLNKTLLKGLLLGGAGKIHQTPTSKVQLLEERFTRSNARGGDLFCKKKGEIHRIWWHGGVGLRTIEGLVGARGDLT